MNAVAGDQHIAGHLRQRRALGVDETGGDAPAALFHAGAAMAGDEILCADPLAHRAEQHALQIGARQADVRP